MTMRTEAGVLQRADDNLDALSGHRPDQHPLNDRLGRGAVAEGMRKKSLFLLVGFVGCRGLEVGYQPGGL